MSNEDIFDTILGDIEVVRSAPNGQYEAVIKGHKQVKNPNSGNNGMEVDFTLLSPLSGQDMNGVDLSAERVSETFWVTPKSARIVRDSIKRIAPDLADDISLREAFEHLVGRRVILDLEQQTEDRKGNALRFPRLNVKSFKAA